MDLSKLSDDDLLALKSGDLSKVSDDGLLHLKGEAPAPTLVDKAIGGVKTLAKNVAGGVRNFEAGTVRGAGSIGSTLMALGEAGTSLAQGKRPSLDADRQRRTDMDAALRELLGADTGSTAYDAGKLGAEVAGTSGVGPVLAGGARLAGAGAPVVNALSSGGFQTGAQLGPLANTALRTLTGATVGGASAGLVNPEEAKTGAVVGGVIPGAVKVAGAVGSAASDALSSAAERLMQSAIKPTLAQLRDGSAATAVRTLLDYGLSPTKAGVDKLRTLIGDKNDQIKALIQGSNATVDRGDVMNTLAGVRSKFSNQVSPTGDLNAIQRVADDFAAHPAVPPQIPVQVAQDLKQGTYKVLSGKYGEAGSAETEAQKALARGLKEGVATAVPEVGALNAEESKLIATLGVAERRALMEANKNPMGLASLAAHPAGWAAFMADRSSAFKALAARIANRTAQSQAGQQALNSPALQALLGRGAPIAVAD